MEPNYLKENVFLNRAKYIYIDRTKKTKPSLLSENDTQSTSSTKRILKSFSDFESWCAIGDVDKRIQSHTLLICLYYTSDVFYFMRIHKFLQKQNTKLQQLSSDCKCSLYYSDGEKSNVLVTSINIFPQNKFIHIYTKRC